MPRNYVDNAMNRSLGRVGMPLGSAVHSRSSGSGYSSSSSNSSSSSYAPRTYVDNYSNRQLGRVGMELGTAVHSRSNSSSSYLECAMSCSGKSSSGSNYGSSSSSSGSTKTYVDNAMNRRLDRVGLEHGTAVHSRSTNSNSTDELFGFTAQKSSRSSDSGNSSSGSTKTYVDNAMNRRLDRVGLEHGTAVHSRSNEDSAVSLSSERAASRVDSASHRSKQGSDSAKSDVKRYVDNALNRKLGRVGKIHGTAVYPRVADNEANRTTCERGTAVMIKNKVYVDNAFNRKYNRVGLPLGSAPIPKQKNVYRETPAKTTQDRCGKDNVTNIFIKNKLSELYRHLDEHFNEELPAELDDLPEEDVMRILDFKQRGEEIEKYLEETTDVNWQPHEHTSRETIQKYQGTIIDFEKLKLGERIGQGGFGEVYFATLDGETVAVKKLKFQKVTKKRLQLFQNEMDVFVKLDHPNIVSFLGACIVAPNLAIVMELMDMSLYDAIHISEVPFAVDDKLEIMRGVTEGMAYLHNQDIAHCDLKTQNVLLINVPGEAATTSSVPVRAKITDFGLSRMKSDVTTSTSVPSARFWTPRYAAPEKHQGKILTLDQQKKADMFSLGLLIWELAVEETPFEDLDPEQLRVHVGQKGLTPAVGHLDRKLQGYVSSCWSMDPDKRPSAQTMAQIGSVLTTLLEPGEE